jgi:hypothetical protein
MRQLRLWISISGFESLGAANLLAKIHLVEVLRCAQDFGSGLPLHSRPLNASSSNPWGAANFPICSDVRFVNIFDISHPTSENAAATLFFGGRCSNPMIP